MAKIGAVCRIIVDGDWIESKDQSECGIRLIQTGNIGIGEYWDKCNRAKYISAETFERLKCTEVLPGDILISRLPDPIGRACAVPKYVGKAITAVDCTIVRLDNSLCDANYFINYTQSVRYGNELSKFLAGTTRTRISRKNLEKIEIPLPPLDEQRKIAAVLDKVSDLIAKRRQQLDKLDEMVKTRFVEIFGDPVCNPNGYLKIKVGEAVARGYIEKPLDGNHGEKHPKTAEYVNDGIPFIMANNLTDSGEVDLIHCAHITRERALRLDKGFAHNLDVLITHKGTIGRTAILYTDLDFVMLTPQVTYYRIKKGMTPDYLKAYFSTDYFQMEMASLAAAGGSTRAYAGITAQLSLPILIPPLPLQKEFAFFNKQTVALKTTVGHSLDKLETLKKALMQEYFG